MKKLIYIVLIAAIMGLSGIGIASVAYAAVSEVVCDEVFIRTVDELYSSEQSTITAQKEVLYDIALEPLGYLYLFDLNDEDNYAIVINSSGIYECAEIYGNAASPYGKLQGLKIYVTAFVYWVYDNDEFYCVNGLRVSDDMFAYFTERAYFAITSNVNSTEVITFASRSESKSELAARVPQYTGIGACVPIAGGNIIHFYTRYCANLMPGFTPGSSLGNGYLYKLTTTEITALVNQLAIDMGTGSNGGTTIPQFMAGMNTYVGRQGYSTAYASCMTNGFLSNLNYTAAKQKFGANQPLVIFCGAWTAATLSVSGSQETIDTYVGSTSHAMASFGYKDITYVFANGTTRADSYLQVSSGLTTRPTGYCRVGGLTTIEDAYAINIF